MDKAQKKSYLYINEIIILILLCIAASLIQRCELRSFSMNYASEFVYIKLYNIAIASLMSPQ